MLDKALKREILELDVTCTYKEDGCLWKGKLRDLEKHTNISQGTCDYVRVLCKWKCGEMIQKKDIADHEEKSCPNRPWYLDFDDSRVRMLAERVHNLEEANSSLQGQLSSVQTQLGLMNGENEKLKAEVEEMKIQQSEVSQNQEELVTQVGSCIDEIQKLKQQEFAAKISYLTDEIQKLKDENVRLSREMSQLSLRRNSLDQNSEKREGNIDEDTSSVMYDDFTTSNSDPILSSTISPDVDSSAPFSFTMKSFEHRKQQKVIWFGPSFYSHSGGYKMQLRVDSSGTQDGEGTHVSVYVYLMKGEFDDELSWPFQGHVTVRILNQLKDSNHYERVIDFPKGTNPLSVNRVTLGGRVKAGHGYSQFIPVLDLIGDDEECRYLKDDSLKFVVFATVETKQVKSSIPLFGRFFN